MAMFRIIKNRDNPYVMLNKEFLSNPKLSWKSKGLLSYLLSKPDDWKINLSDLINKSNNGRDSVRAGIKELIDNKYIIKTQARLYGKFDKYIYDVYEKPTEVGKSDFGKSEVDKSNTTNKRKKKVIKKILYNNPYRKKSFSRDNY